MEAVVLVQPLRHRQRQAKLRLQLFLQTRYIPLLFHAHWRDKAIDRVVHHILADSGNGLLNPVIREQFVTLTINNLTLIVGDIVILQQLLANIEVAPLDLALRLLNGVGDHAMLNGFTALHTQCLHKALDPL